MEPKLIDAGVNSTAVPTPESAAVCGLVGSLSFTLTVPCWNPTRVGLNCRSITQLPLLAIFKLFVQVDFLLMTKPVVTVSAGLPRVNVPPVLLVSVMVCTGLRTPTGVTGKLIEEGVSTTLLVPVPLIPASCGLLGSLSLMTRVPCLKPVDCGWKVRPMVQFLPPPNGLPLAGQLLDEMVKSVVSVKVMVPMVMLLEPVLVMVTFCGPLLLPTNVLGKLTGAPVIWMAVPVPERAMVGWGLK